MDRDIQQEVERVDEDATLAMLDLFARAYPDGSSGAPFFAPVTLWASWHWSAFACMSAGPSQLNNIRMIPSCQTAAI